MSDLPLFMIFSYLFDFILLLIPVILNSSTVFMLHCLILPEECVFFLLSGFIFYIFKWGNWNTIIIIENTTLSNFNRAVLTLDDQPKDVFQVDFILFYATFYTLSTILY